MIDQSLRTQPKTLLQYIAQFTLALFGWKAVGQKPPFKKYLMVGAHHTTNWDLPFGLLVMTALGVRVHWIAKDTVFKGPLGKLAYWFGGIPVNRRERTNFTQQIIEKFDEADELVIVISPEGTRSKTDYWRTGFYYIAHGANVPIVMAFLDYSSKTGGFGPSIKTSGDIEKDLEKMGRFYAGVRGKYPHNHGRIELKPDAFEELPQTKDKTN